MLCAVAQLCKAGCISIRLRDHEHVAKLCHMHNQAPSAKLSAATASAESGIPKRTILYAITAGHLRAEKIPGLGYVIRRSDFARYLAGRDAKASA